MKLLKIIVKHTCGHFKIIEIPAKSDADAAIAEAHLQSQPCQDCLTAKCLSQQKKG